MQSDGETVDYLMKILTNTDAKDLFTHSDEEVGNRRFEEVIRSIRLGLVCACYGHMKVLQCAPVPTYMRTLHDSQRQTKEQASSDHESKYSRFGVVNSTAMRNKFLFSLVIQFMFLLQLSKPTKSHFRNEILKETCLLHRTELVVYYFNNITQSLHLHQGSNKNFIYLT